MLGLFLTSGESCRSTFEVNTNVWASREPRFIPYLEVCETWSFACC
jgi:hypothetical protein